MNMDRSLEEDKEDIYRIMSKNGCEMTDLSQNELAKTHIRHLSGVYVYLFFLLCSLFNILHICMLGGRAINQSMDMMEFLYRFEFPEAPGEILLRP